MSSFMWGILSRRFRLMSTVCHDRARLAASNVTSAEESPKTAEVFADPVRAVVDAMARVQGLSWSLAV